MYRLIYNCLFYLAIPLVLLRLLKRSVREPGYRATVAQRFGGYRSPRAGSLIWVHAVSAGETVAAAPLVQKLLDEGYPCLVTNMTPTGRERVEVLLGDAVETCYAPYDLPGSVARFLDRNQPKLLITIDTELWPNIIQGCRDRSIPTMVVNGRMSARSAAGYARFPALVEPMMSSISSLAVQTKAHGERFQSLGAMPERIHVTGSIKFDGQFARGHEQRLAGARALVGARPVLLGASTHEGEEAALIELLPDLAAVVDDVVLILAPRHTHRADQVARLSANAGYQLVRFSELDGKPLAAGTRILMLDVMGELESFFPVARLAFIGGSLVPVGGHNLLEAVRAGTAVLMGSHLDNIDDIAQQFIDQNAMSVVHNLSELRDEVIGYMRDEGRVRRMVNAADEVLERNQGALDRVFGLILKVLSGS